MISHITAVMNKKYVAHANSYNNSNKVDDATVTFNKKQHVCRITLLSLHFSFLVTRGISDSTGGAVCGERHSMVRSLLFSIICE